MYFQQFHRAGKLAVLANILLLAHLLKWPSSGQWLSLKMGKLRAMTQPWACPFSEFAQMNFLRAMTEFENFTEFENALEQNHCYTWHVTCCRFYRKPDA